MKDGNRRVVISGLGTVTACGIGWESLWDAVSGGRSHVDFLTRFALDDLPVRIAAEVNGFDPLSHMSHRSARRLDRSGQFALAAARLALEDGGLDNSSYEAERCGVIDGSSLNSLGAALERQREYMLGNKKKGGPETLIFGMPGNSSSAICLEFGFKGAAATLSHGSVSSTSALGWGLRSIQEGDMDIVISGGTETPIYPEIFIPFANSRVLSRSNGNPAAACKPFASDRDGFALGEGAVYCVLEELQHAIDRNATIYCELSGFAENSDSYHHTAPDPEGKMLSYAILAALKDAGSDLPDVGYVNLHGTATRINDLSESKAVRRIFGERESQPRIGSTKPVAGHLLGACGALEAAVIALALKNQYIPPTLNCYPADELCGVNCSNGTGYSEELSLAVSTNSSFGGRNCCLVFKRHEPE